jgi:hypothetical protein
MIFHDEERAAKGLAVVVRTWIRLLFSAPMIAVLAGCGGSTANVQNPPAPASMPVSITFTPSPPTAISLGASTTISAVIGNDPSNAGVNWVLLCQNPPNCGTLLPLHTSSGAPATYTPPSTISGNSQTFTIEAFATADNSKNVSTAITVTGFASNLKGTYVFETEGLDINGAFQLAGVIVLDGDGGITFGEQTHNDPLLSRSDPIRGGSYYIGPDGRGTLTLNTADQNIGQAGIENLSLVFLSSSHALIATLDNPTLQVASNETSSGTLDLQTSTTPPTGGYAFAVIGTDLVPSPMALGGVLTIVSPNTISEAGSVVDQDDAGNVTLSATLSGTTTNPDSFGALTFNLTTSLPSTSSTPTPIQFTGYIVDAQHLKLIESDNAGSGAGFGSTAGLAIGQGAATGTFTSSTAFSGNYVFGILGQDLSGALGVTLASVGEFTADAGGNLSSGYNDEVLIGFGDEVSDSFTGTYALDSTGTGRAAAAFDFTSPSNGTAQVIFYLTGNGNPPLVLDAVTASDGEAVGVGLARPQVAPPFSFNGKYGLRFTQGSSGGVENDGTGQLTVNGTADTLSGVIDTDLGFNPQPNTTLTGTFAAIPSTGRSTGGLTNTFFPTPGSVPDTIAVAFYLIDSSHGYFIETDSLTSGELSLGYFAARTPVCPTCP